MFGLKSLKVSQDFRSIEEDVSWWFSANMNAVVRRASEAKTAASESQARLNAAKTYYESIKELKLNQIEATKAGYVTMVDCQSAEKRLGMTKKSLKQKLLQAGLSASQK